ncbi:uncharacterized protein LOC127098650 isoform X2 [Lathyrus oleraceus]|uniref:uncharacterized protein LOC127098650 isoform X2 n=1 Tax=Pisum sativum TaxID=3888 RepID=UPI001FC6706A|nr:uncharacterized protein LOC127098650 isoform X2 [Pisum sativum]
MEHRSTFTTCYFLFLFLFLVLPHCSKGESEGILSSDSDIYEIDYKGPETHSSVPPPHHYPHSIPRKDIVRAENVFGSATLATNKAS